MWPTVVELLRSILTFLHDDVPVSISLVVLLSVLFFLLVDNKQHSINFYLFIIRIILYCWFVLFSLFHVLLWSVAVFNKPCFHGNWEHIWFRSTSIHAEKGINLSFLLWVTYKTCAIAGRKRWPLTSSYHSLIRSRSFPSLLVSSNFPNLTHSR